MKILTGNNIKPYINDIKKINLSLPKNKTEAIPINNSITPNKSFSFIRQAFLFIKENLYLAKYKFLNYLYSDEPLMLNARDTVNKSGRTLIAQYIKPALRKMINGKVNPAELDRRLTKLAGKENVVEEVFRPTPETGITMGRKRTYYLPGGSTFELECHDWTKEKEVRYVTRLSDVTKNRDRRSYINSDGDLMVNTYRKYCTHLDAGDYGLDWINKNRKIK